MEVFPTNKTFAVQKIECFHGGNGGGGTYPIDLLTPYL